MITGEGAVDRQTFMGKGVGRVAELCRHWQVPCLALAGTVPAPKEAARWFARVAALTEVASLAQAKSTPEYYLRRLSASMADGL